MQSEYICSLPQLKELMSYWVKNLHLEAWDIKLEFGNAKDMVLDDDEVVGGLTNMLPVEQQAQIKIITNEGWREIDAVFPQDMEVLLVHELLHLVWHPFMPEEEQKAAIMSWHRQLHSTAKLLVELKRNKRGK